MGPGSPVVVLPQLPSQEERWKESRWGNRTSLQALSFPRGEMPWQDVLEEREVPEPGLGSLEPMVLWILHEGGVWNPIWGWSVSRTEGRSGNRGTDQGCFQGGVQRPLGTQFQALKGTLNGPDF